MVFMVAARFWGDVVVELKITWICEGSRLVGAQAQGLRPLGSETLLTLGSATPGLELDAVDCRTDGD
jgi:hypothetical protein